MRTAYIAGPMRGMPHLNFPAFFEAERVLRACGWNVLNPARMDKELDGLDPDSPSIRPVDHYIRRDFEAIMSLEPGSDALVLLNGWDVSVGATAEVALARWRGLELIRYADLVEQQGVTNAGRTA